MADLHILSQNNDISYLSDIVAIKKKSREICRIIFKHYADVAYVNVYNVQSADLWKMKEISFCITKQSTTSDDLCLLKDLSMEFFEVEINHALLLKIYFFINKDSNYISFMTSLHSANRGKKNKFVNYIEYGYGKTTPNTFTLPLWQNESQDCADGNLAYKHQPIITTIIKHIEYIRDTHYKLEIIRHYYIRIIKKSLKEYNSISKKFICVKSHPDKNIISIKITDEYFLDLFFFTSSQIDFSIQLIGVRISDETLNIINSIGNTDISNKIFEFEYLSVILVRQIQNAVIDICDTIYSIEITA